MRILLAVDGSVSSDRAAELVSTLQLPPKSVVRVIAVHRAYLDVLSLAWATGGDNGYPVESQDEAEARHQREAVERYERLLLRPSLTIEGFVLRGRPGSAIVDEADAMEADLIVLGSRGHGTISTMLLGSTAAEVVDHAPCPVLVARANALGSIAFADDGSAPARRAEAVLAEWPIFADARISVVTVAETTVPVAAGFTPGLYDQVLESYARSIDEAREEVRAEADSAATRLTAAGRPAEPVALEGDPATELVRFVTSREVGTIVMGTRGHTGITRLLLGSVARNVLVHAPCSVLIAREPR
jgi:nucleotide-binding universal stress UspA family protein